MNIEKTVKFFVFALLALLPIVLGLMFFDYNSLNKFQLIRDFGINNSLIAIAVSYTGVAICIRLAMYYALGIVKDKRVLDIISESSFMDIFYVSCAEVLFYSSIPVILTYYLKGDFIAFISHSLIVWGVIFTFWIVWLLVIRNKQILKG